ncbi:MULTISPECIES: hypothetical protein [Helicobacter]|uniref:hypothetical protein n=1 Tax=Helicobacter TaxID=209 RepID=UPI00202AA552|nr:MULTISPECIES: hypothetical protein [Helicobacter]MCL9822071.1 hypothetical protein [Helicobacter colisuis]MDY5615679.1 hypothetical protein [Helicobacter sp.]
MFFRIALLLFSFNIYVLANILPSCNDVRVQRDLKQQLEEFYITKAQEYFAKKIKNKQNRGDFSDKDQNFYNSLSEEILQEFENTFEEGLIFRDFQLMQDFLGIRYCRARIYHSIYDASEIFLNFGIEGIYAIMQIGNELSVTIITGFGRDIELQ